MKFYFVIIQVVACAEILSRTASACSCMVPPGFKIEGTLVKYLSYASADWQTKVEVVVPGADAASFESLSPPERETNKEDRFRERMCFCPGEKPYGRDGKSVFYKTRLIPGAEPANFRVLNQAYAADRRRVFYEGRPLPDAEPARFEELQAGISKSNLFRYCGDEKMLESSFTELPLGFAKDARRVCFRGAILPVKHAASFRVDKESDYALDDLSLYSLKSGREIASVNSNSLRRFKAGLVADDSKVIYKDEVVPGADGKTFRALTATGGIIPIKPYWADAKSVFHDAPGKLVPLEGRDAASFRALQWNYTKDKSGVYYEDARIEGADPATFENASMGGKDRRGRYKGARFVGP